MSIFEYDKEKELKLYREAEYLYGLEEGLEKGQAEGKETGLQAMVTSLKRLLPDFEAVYQTVTANEAYRDYTREQVGKYY